MEKRSLGVILIGYFIIISGLLTIWFSFFSSALKHTESSLLFSNILCSIAIFPRGLPFFFSYLTNLGYPIGKFIFKFIFIWMICMIFCGVGILFLKDIARKAFIGLSSVHILTFVIFRISLLANPPSYHATSSSLTDMFFKINFNFLVFLIPLIYIVYLMQPKVKEQFK